MVLNEVALQYAELSPFVSVFISLSVLISMVTLVSLCSFGCCAKKGKGEVDPEDVYNVIPADEEDRGAAGGVQFRNGGQSLAERHSQPAGRHHINPSSNPSRASAPLQRALPQLPRNGNSAGDLYAAIDKRPSVPLTNVAAIRDPMYESIDPENDSIIDPLYSKVDPRSTRKYDYPVFAGTSRRSGERTETTQRHDTVTRTVYADASQIYAAASEDPYSSIASAPGCAPRARMDEYEVEEDSGSACDPGYAKVQKKRGESSEADGERPDSSEREQERERTEQERERTEQELDRLYSKIRRHRSRSPSSSEAGPSSSSSAPPPSLPVALPDAPEGPVMDLTGGDVGMIDDGDAASSREPSYRYITVRENAETVRERLRASGQLGEEGRGGGGGGGVGARREHYYSTIGNEYESVGDAGSSQYSAVGPPAAAAAASRPLSHPTGRPTEFRALALSPTEEFVPPPPTSPIPQIHRESSASVGRDPMSSSGGSEVWRAGGGGGGGAGAGAGERAPSTPVVGMPPRPNNIIPVIRPLTFRSYEDRLRSPVTPNTYSSSYTRQSPSEGGGQSSRGLGQFSNGLPPPPIYSVQRPSVIDQSATDFNQRPANGRPSAEYAPFDYSRSDRPSELADSARGHQTLQLRGSVGRGDFPETVLDRKVTEEREVVISHYRTCSAESTPVRETAGGEGPCFLSRRDSSLERVHRVPIRRVEGSEADGIIAARRYRQSQDSLSALAGVTRSLMGEDKVDGEGGGAGGGGGVPVMQLNLQPPSSRASSLPGPSSPCVDSGEDTADRPRRSLLPRSREDRETRRLADKARTRRQESIEREAREAESARSARSSGPPTDRTGGLSARSRSRRRDESEEDKIRRLGTIYTANDYVSTIGMGTERGWPFVAHSSPPSVRREREEAGRREREREKENEEGGATARGEDVQQLPGACQMPQPSGGIFTWSISSIESEGSCGDGGCSDGACFCHGSSSRPAVARENRAQMDAVFWGTVPDDDDFH